MKLKIEVDLTAKEAQELVEGHMDILHRPVQDALRCATQVELAEEFTECMQHAEVQINQSVMLFCQAMDEAMPTHRPYTS